MGKKKDKSWLQRTASIPHAGAKANTDQFQKQLLGGINSNASQRNTWLSLFIHCTKRNTWIVSIKWKPLQERESNRDSHCRTRLLWYYDVRLIADYPIPLLSACLSNDTKDFVARKVGFNNNIANILPDLSWYSLDSANKFLIVLFLLLLLLYYTED